MPTYSVPKKIRDYVQKAIDYNRSLPKSRRAAMKRLDNGDLIEGTGHKTAKKLIRGDIDYKQMKLMSAWFARHGNSKMEKEARRNRTSKASIAYALWGGNAARIWVRKMIIKIEKELRDT